MLELKAVNAFIPVDLDSASILPIEAFANLNSMFSKIPCPCLRTVLAQNMLEVWFLYLKYPSNRELF